MMEQLRSLVKTALKDNGASTKPLAQLLAATFDAEKFNASKASSYFVRLVCRISKRLFISLIPAKLIIVCNGC